MRLQPVVVPYRYDDHDEGLGQGPGALLRAGLLDRVRALGHELADPVEAHLPDTERDRGSIAVNIGRLGANTATHVAAARRAGHGVLVLAGDDTAAIGVMAGLQQADGLATPIGIVWVDAHGDFNTPETSYSGILAGMPVAIMAGLAGPLWRRAAGLVAPIPTDRIVIAGIRDLDSKEETLIRSTDVRVVTSSDIRAGSGFASAIRALAADCHAIYLHIDLDVLDPRLVPSASTPSANGLEINETVKLLTTVLSTGQVAAMSIASLNPGAGNRGERSIRSTLALLEHALSAWTATPAAP
jgi:arginase